MRHAFSSYRELGLTIAAVCTTNLLLGQLDGSKQNCWHCVLDLDNHSYSWEHPAVCQSGNVAAIYIPCSCLTDQDGVIAHYFVGCHCNWWVLWMLIRLSFFPRPPHTSSSYPTPLHFVLKGLLAQLVEQSHQSCDGRGFDSHPSPDIFFSFQIDLRTSFYTSVIDLIFQHFLCEKSGRVWYQKLHGKCPIRCPVL